EDRGTQLHGFASPKHGLPNADAIDAGTIGRTEIREDELVVREAKRCMASRDCAIGQPERAHRARSDEDTDGRVRIERVARARVGPLDDDETVGSVRVSRRRTRSSKGRKLSRSRRSHAPYPTPCLPARLRATIPSMRRALALIAALVLI